MHSLHSFGLSSLAGTVPSPPHDKLPFVAGNIALAVAALVVVHCRHRAAPWVAALAALSYLPSVGPHKILTEVHAAALTPVIAVGTVSIAVVWLCALVGTVALFYTGYLLYVGIPTFLNIDREEGLSFASSTLAIGVLVLEVLLALTVVLWGYGYRLF